MASIVQYLPRCVQDLHQTISNVRNHEMNTSDNAVELAVLVGRIIIAAGICFAMKKGSLFAAGLLASASFPAAALAGGAMFMKYGATALKTGLLVNQMHMAVAGTVTLAIGYGVLNIYKGNQSNGLLDAFKDHHFVSAGKDFINRTFSNVHKQDQHTNKSDNAVELAVSVGRIIIAAGICFAIKKGSLFAAGLLASASFPAAALAGGAMFMKYGAIAFKTGLLANQIYETVAGIFPLAIGCGLLLIHQGKPSNGLLDVFRDHEFVDMGREFIVSLLGAR